MPSEEEVSAANRLNWSDRAALHAERGTGYHLEAFVDDRAALSNVVRFDLPRLGSIEGLRAVHLQCHVGDDTLSLARLGAQVTGLDFSPVAITEARKLVAETGDAVTFVEAEVYRALDVLPRESFDLVYTGIGAICWLPRIDEWAAVVAALLAPGGRVFMREAHPVLWALDDSPEPGLRLTYPYFEMTEPSAWDDAETYVQADGALTHTRSYDWNHGLGEIMTALMNHGLRITMFAEHDSIPWQALPGQMVQRDGGEWALADHPERAPLSYTIQAVRDASRAARE